jgi:threonylcarbamoyladenosine tRNA methylthiotransferase MtaB
MSSPDRSPRIITFGCRLNAYESEVMRDLATSAGIGEAVIVNTCAVTAEAERQARQAIRRARREHPLSSIIVTGCAAQIDPARYAAMPEVDRVLGNEEKLRARSFAMTDDTPRVQVDDIMSVRHTAGHLIDGLNHRTRAFVQVQQGCDHRCTFCVIPYGRGNSRSVPVGEIVRQVRRLADKGVPEVVLSGVDITSYGADLPGRPNLGSMVRRLLAQVTALPRLRLSSIDAVEIDRELFALLAEEPRLMPHLHLSLQSGDDLILKRMKRRHSRADALALVSAVRRVRPDVVFGADLIAGFPTETGDMFTNTLTLVEDCGLTHLHVFPYSERPGTPAARMPQVPRTLRKERAAHLRQAGERALARFLDSRVGREERILVERPGFGLSEHFAPARCPDAEPGQILSFRTTGHVDGNLIVGPLVEQGRPSSPRRASLGSAQ